MINLTKTNKSTLVKVLLYCFIEIFIITQLLAFSPSDALATRDISGLENISFRVIRGYSSIDAASDVLGWIDSPVGTEYSFYAKLSESQKQTYRDVVKRMAPILSSNEKFKMRSLEAQALMFWAIWDISRSRVISPEHIAQNIMAAVSEAELLGNQIQADPAYYTLDPQGRRQFEGRIKLTFSERIQDLRQNQQETLVAGIADAVKAIPANVMRNIKNTLETHPLASRISLDLLAAAVFSLPYFFGLNWATGSVGLQAFLSGLVYMSALPRGELVVDKYMSKLFTTPNYVSGVKPGTYLTDKAMMVFPCGGMPVGIKETISNNPGMPFVILTFENYGKQTDVEKFIQENEEFLQENGSEVIHMHVPVQYWFKRGNLNDMAQFIVNHLTPLANGEETGFRSDQNIDQSLLDIINSSGEDRFSGIDIDQMIQNMEVANETGNNSKRHETADVEYYKVGESGLSEVEEIDSEEYKRIQDELNQFTNKADNNQAAQRTYWRNAARKVFGKEQYQVFPRVIRTDWKIVGDSVVAQDWMVWKDTNGDEYLIRRTKVALDQIVGDITKLADRKYRFVMDQDNIIPAGVAMKMLQILEDPLNQPVVENGELIRGMAGFGTPVLVSNPGESSLAEFGSRGRFVGIPYIAGYGDWFKSVFSIGKLVENMEVAENLQRGLANRNQLSEDIIVASLLNLGFSRTQADLTLKYMRSVSPPDTAGDMPQTIMHLLEGDVADYIQGLARQVRWDEGDIYNFLYSSIPGLGTLNQEGQWENTPIPGHLKWHMLMNVVGISLDLSLPLFVGTWFASEFLPDMGVAIGSNPLLLSHFALTMGSLYYMFHYPKTKITGFMSSLRDMGRSQILLQNIVNRIPNAFKHLKGAFFGEKIEWGVFGQASAGLTNNQMIKTLKSTWMSASAATLGIAAFSPTIWPMAFGSFLLGSLIASPFLNHTMGRAEEGILDTISAVKGMDGVYDTVLTTLETVNYPNGISNRLVQLAQKWNQKRIVYETEYNLVPEEYTLGIGEDEVFMTDAWSMLTEAEREGLKEAFGESYEIAKLNFFETIAQVVVQKARISNGYDIQRTAVGSVLSSDSQYKKLYRILEADKREKLPIFVDVMTKADNPWASLNAKEKNIVKNSQGSNPLSDETAQELFNGFIAAVSTGRDTEILNRADDVIEELGIPLDTLTGYLRQAAPYMFSGHQEISQEDAVISTKRMIYSMYLDGIRNFEDEFEKLLVYSQVFEDYTEWEQKDNNADATINEQLNKLNEMLEEIER